jgi:hypothetical protein
MAVSVARGHPGLRRGRLYLKVREGGRIVSVAAIIAVAVNIDGRREIVGLGIAPSEAEPPELVEGLVALHQGLVKRGLKGVKLVISDAHDSLRHAITRGLSATWQRCRVPWMRNALAHVPKGQHTMVAAAIRQAFLQPDAAAAHNPWRQVADQLRVRWDCTLEPIGDKQHAVRLGLRLVRGLADKDAAAIVAARADTHFGSIDELWQRAAVPIAAPERLADADAFRPSLHLACREAVRAIRALRDRPLPLFEADETHAGTLVAEASEPAVALRPMKAGREVVEDYNAPG